jgi:phosphoribosyl 1,2-cyclic phosphodiesterase
MRVFMDCFCSLASSSSGNSYLLCHKGAVILIDAGISALRITAGLREFGLTPADLGAVLVTHEHIDHVKGLPTLLKRTKAKVFLTGGTYGALRTDEDRTYIYGAGDSFELCGLHVRSFKTPHDAAESVGFRFDGEGFSFGFATDLGYMPVDGEELLKGVDYALIESNYDKGMLYSGSYPYYLKMHISSTRGHQENGDCGALASRLVQNGTKTVMLAHLSRNNNTPDIARETVSAALEQEQIRVGEGCRFEGRAARYGGVFCL